MTLPTPDAQSARFWSHDPQMSPLSHSIPVMTPMSSPSPSGMPPSFASEASNRSAHHEHTIDFATHSLDLATGGLKTLTAKRELPMRPDRRAPDIDADLATSHSYMFVLVMLTCVVLMLIGGGIILFIMLQP